MKAGTIDKREALKMFRIYIEYTLYGKFGNALFSSWNQYYDFTFNPDIEIKVIKKLK